MFTITTRTIAARRLPRLTVASQRFVSDGSVAKSREFKQREAAEEGNYAHKKDVEKLLALKADLEKHKKELEAMEKEVNESLAKK